MRGLCLLVLVVASTATLAGEIKTVRMWSAPDRTRVVFDVSEPLQYRLFTMTKPDRVVIDFAHTREPKNLHLPIANREPLKGLRYARRGDHDLRVVLDLTRDLIVTDSLLPPRQRYGHRLVLDLSPPVEQTPAARKNPPPKHPRKQRPPGPRDIVVAIDAGHGGDDVGAIGPSGAYEKDLVLAVSLELARLINQHAGMCAVLVRKGDYYVGLRKRMLLARDAAADLFVSIHADAFRDRRVRGSSVYVLSQRGASSEAAHWLAENANRSDLIGGVSLDDKDDVLKSVLLELSQSASLDASIDAANVVLGALKEVGHVHKNDVQHAGFMVLKSPDIPSLLVETAFISNPAEERRLRNKKFRRRLAAAIYNGIHKYFSSNPPPGVRMAAREHRVVSGDSLSVIAERYAVSMESIKLANNLPNDGVRLGALLKIP